MTSPRRWLWFAAPVLLLSCLGTITVRNVYRRAERTRLAFTAPASAGSLKAQLLSRGCVAVAVLPMLDFEELAHSPLVGTRAEARLAVCEVAAHGDCAVIAAGLQVTSPLELLVRAAPNDYRCQAHVDSSGRVTENVPFLSRGTVIMHPPPRRPWYVYPLAFAHRAWQHLAYR